MPAVCQGPCSRNPRRRLCGLSTRRIDFSHHPSRPTSSGWSVHGITPAPRIDAVGTYSTFERASYTAPYNLTGLPALSVPIGFESGLPLAFQIAGKPFDEAAVLRTGYAFEQAAGLHLRQPPIAASLPSR